MNKSFESQIIEACKKGDSVSCFDGTYRVQEDKGWLHIVVHINGKRKKYGIDAILPEFGSEADYIFNRWYLVYPSYDMYYQFCLSEIKWLK